MKILVVSQCFYPDDFRINDIVDSMVKEGHSVRVLTGLPDYAASKIPKGYRFFKKRRETWHGAEIVRVPTAARRSGVFFRALNYSSFVFWGFFYARFCRFKADVVFSYQTSPVLQAIPACTYRKRTGVPLVLYCCDLWPESLKAWNVQETGFLYRHILKLSRRIYGRCDKVAVTSRPFRGYLEDVDGVADDRIVYLPQHAEDLYSDICGQYEENGCIDFLFAGNIGAVQNVDCIIRAAAAIRTEKDYKIHIVGAGSEAEACIKLAKECGVDDHVVFHGKFPLNEMKRFYKTADCFLLTLRGGDFVGLTLPAKTQGYLSAGKPVAAAIDGAAAELINEAGCGECVPAGDAQGLALAMTKIIENFEPYRQKGLNGRRYYENYFTREIFMRRLNELFDDAVKSKRAMKH